MQPLRERLPRRLRFVVLSPAMKHTLPRERPDTLTAEQRSALIDGAVAYWKAAVERQHLFDFGVSPGRCECPSTPQNNAVRITVALDVPAQGRPRAGYNSIYPLKLLYLWSQAEYRTDDHEEALHPARNAVMRLMGLGDPKRPFSHAQADHQPPLKDRAARIFERGIVWKVPASYNIDIESVPQVLRAVGKVKSLGGVRVSARAVPWAGDVAPYATVDLGFADGAARAAALNELRDLFATCKPFSFIVRAIQEQRQREDEAKQAAEAATANEAVLAT